FCALVACPDLEFYFGGFGFDWAIDKILNAFFHVFYVWHKFGIRALDVLFLWMEQDIVAGMTHLEHDITKCFFNVVVKNVGLIGGIDSV
ncbi:hypothetical protein ACJX0J_032845, partial [Zea mays]